MKTKKFEGKTEQEALEKVRDELGLSAIVLSIKKNIGKGLKALFIKPTVVVTAVYDESEVEKDKVLAAALEAVQVARQKEPYLSEGLQDDILPSEPLSINQSPADIQNEDKDMQIAYQQQVIRQLENVLAKAESKLTEREQTVQESVSPNNESNMLQMFRSSLANQGVSPEIADKILENAKTSDLDCKRDINLLVKMVYNNIMEILGGSRMLNDEEENYSGYDTNVMVFIGSTGVGKTTTIAKLSSFLLLNHRKQVGLITEDTYRIAAVEQLKTYAEIIGLDLNVIYNRDEILDSVERLQEYNDVILIDTAGRNHRNRENMLELKVMLDYIPDSSKFLVLSVTTRQEDMLGAIKAYEAITDFDLIFTKLDETMSLGVLLNICYLTGKKVSYVSFGQNVPDDIEKMQPDKIAKSLMVGFSGHIYGTV